MYQAIVNLIVQRNKDDSVSLLMLAFQAFMHNSQDFHIAAILKCEAKLFSKTCS